MTKNKTSFVHCSRDGIYSPDCSSSDQHLPEKCRDEWICVLTCTRVSVYILILASLRM